MIWLTWRQLRTHILAAVVVLGAAAIYLIVTGVRMHHTYTTDLSYCPRRDRCQYFDHLSHSYNTTQVLIQLFLLAVPALIGIFWGTPLIAAEFERGTHRMIWNQSITPLRWLTVKLLTVGLFAVAIVGLLSLLFTWWASPLDAINPGRFDWNIFTTRNLTPLGYAAFAFALGAALGLLTRRALPAMALTLAVFIGMQFVVATQIRPHLLPTKTASVAVDSALRDGPIPTSITTSPGGASVTLEMQGPKGSWKLSQSPLEDGSGATISSHDLATCFQPQDLVPPPSQDSLASCLAPFHPHINVTYEPASSYWPLQWLETGLYVALAGLLGGFCFWRLRRNRD